MANSAMERRYSMMRQQLGEQEAQARGEETEALRRRFASMGALGSGAAIKTEQKAQQASQRRLQSGYGQLDVARLAEEQGMEEAQKQREFTSGEAEKQRGWGTSEAEKQRGFMAGEAEKQRGFTTSERLAGQEYLTGENLAQREYATRERQAGEVFQSGLVDKQLAAQLTNLLKQIAVQKEQFTKEFDLNKEIAYFNMYGKGGKPKPNPLSQMSIESDISRGMQNINFSGMGGGYPTLNYSSMG